MRTNCLFDRFTYIPHAKPCVPLYTGDRDDGRLRTLTKCIEFCFDLRSELLRDVDDTITDFGHVPDVPDSFDGVIARMDLDSDGGKAIDAVFVSDYSNLIHKAFSPSL